MIELVWDAGRAGTLTVGVGSSVTVGERARFSPDELVASAAASCLMRTFLRLAEEAHTPILSYAATANAVPACESGVAPHVAVHAYISAAPPANRAALVALADRSTRVSPIIQLLGDHVAVTCDVRVVSGAAAARS